MKINARSYLPLAVMVFCIHWMGLENAAGQNSKGMLLALSKTDHTLALVDLSSLQVLAKIPVGADPHEVVASTDGKLAYVSNTLSGQGSEINVIDLHAYKALPSIQTKPLIGPHGLTVSAGSIWFSAEGAKAVGRIDPLTGRVDWAVGTGEDRTHMIYVTPDAKQVYTTNANAGSVSILFDTLLPAPPFPGAKPRQDWAHRIVKVTKGVEGFDVSPDGKELWATSADDGTIFIIDLATRKLVLTLDAKAIGANRLKFTPDGKRALISSLRTGDFIVIDVAARKEIKRLTLGKGAAGILVEPNGLRAFVGCTPDNYVAIIDLTKLEVMGHLTVGGGPDGLAWASKN